MCRATNVTAALARLENSEIPTVVCEQYLGDESSREVLEGIACLRRPLFLVVTSRLADQLSVSRSPQPGRLRRPGQTLLFRRSDPHPRLCLAALDELAQDLRREPRLPTGQLPLVHFAVNDILTEDVRR
jgi:hypothetical protein